MFGISCAFDGTDCAVRCKREDATAILTRHTRERERARKPSSQVACVSSGESEIARGESRAPLVRSPQMYVYQRFLSKTRPPHQCLRPPPNRKSVLSFGDRSKTKIKRRKKFRLTECVEILDGHTTNKRLP